MWAQLQIQRLVGDDLGKGHASVPRGPMLALLSWRLLR